MTRPGDKDVEVHLFGPGYGESVLVHLGFNQWLIVDSCVARGSRAAAPTAYLESIDVDPATAVKVIVASHWHDDHVRGLSEVVRKCKSAEFWCSGALRERDFFILMSAVTKRPMTRAGSGVDEFRGVIEELRARAAGQRIAGIRLHFAESDKLIWQRQIPEDHVAVVHSLSPSDAERLLSMQAIAGLVRGLSEKRPRGRVPPIRPNNTAIALHVRVGDAHLLLGADLEEIGEPPLQDCGWSAVVASTRRPSAKSTLFKVAHHGSETAHCEPVWTEMLEPKPLGILTPFRNGSVRLPTEADAMRLRARAGDVFITARHATRRAKPANPVVAREFGLTARAVWEAAAMGHLRASIPEGQGRTGWRVTTLNGATRL